MDANGYEEIGHTADWGLRVHGEDLKDLFRNAAFGMLALMGISAAQGPVRKYLFELEAEDSETLLVSFLEEILYKAESEHQALDGITFEAFQPQALKASISLRPMLGIAKEIKAVTFHGLEIKQSPAGLETEIVFDV